MSRFEFDFLVPLDHPALSGHFPGQPIVPGVLLLDHVLDAVRKATGRPVARLREVKFRQSLLPDERARASCDVEEGCTLFRVSVRSERGSVTIATGNLLLVTVDGQRE